MADENDPPSIQEVPDEAINTILEKKLGSTNFVVLKKCLTQLTTPGLLGDHMNLDISVLNNEGIETRYSFFVKFLPKIEAQAQFAIAIGAFSKEIFVYELFEEFKKEHVKIIASAVPNIYFAEDNRCLVLDNLIEDGYVQVDKHKTLDYNSILVILNTLSKFHASTIVFEKKRGKTLLELYGNRFSESFFGDSEGFANKKGIDASILGVLREIDFFMFPTILNSGKNFKEVAKKECEKIFELVRPSARFKNVLTHGDMWSTNFLLKREGSDCKLVDFQSSRYTPPAQDVLSLIYLTTSRSFRSKHLYELLGVYYSYLEKHLRVSGVDPNVVLPFNHFMDSCEDQKLFAITLTAIYFQLILLKDGVASEYFQREDRDKIFFQDRGLLVEDYAEKDEDYRNRLIESIQDLKDYCERL